MIAMIPGAIAMEGNESFLFLSNLGGAISAILLLYYCGYALLHSTQHIDSPRERTKWFYIIVLVNVFGAMFYYFTKYKDLKKEGRGNLLKF